MDPDTNVTVTGSTTADYPPVIIFDWDDTFLPTAILRALTQVSAGQSLQREFNPETYDFHVVAAAASRTLELASTLGYVMLITNGSNSWIESSCKKYLPFLWQQVSRFERISAQDLAGGVHLDPMEWKKAAFKNILDTHFDSYGTNSKVVVSIGDSLHERHALFHYQHESRHSSSTSIRSLKFIPMPDCKRLVRQHTALIYHLKPLVELPSKYRAVDLRYFFTLHGNQTPEERVMEFTNRDLRDCEDLQRGNACDLIDGDLTFQWVDNSSLEYQVEILETEKSIYWLEKARDCHKTIASPMSSLAGDETRTSMVSMIINTASKHWERLFGESSSGTEKACWARRVSDGNPFLMLVDTGDGISICLD